MANPNGAKKKYYPKAKTPQPEKANKTSFQPGNKLWQKCENPGQDKKYKTPEDLWKAAVAYFTWCDNNPLEAIEYYGKDATMCIVPKMRPYTWGGLSIFLCNFSLTRYKTDYAEFAKVITRIEQIIYTQKFEGASSGFFNANIIARDLGLIDKQEVSQTKFKVTRKP